MGSKETFWKCQIKLLSYFYLLEVGKWVRALESSISYVILHIWHMLLHLLLQLWLCRSTWEKVYLLHRTELLEWLCGDILNWQQSQLKLYLAFLVSKATKENGKTLFWQPKMNWFEKWWNVFYDLFSLCSYFTFLAQHLRKKKKISGTNTKPVWWSLKLFPLFYWIFLDKFSTEYLPCREPELIVIFASTSVVT